MKKAEAVNAQKQAELKANTGLIGKLKELWQKTHLAIKIGSILLLVFIVVNAFLPTETMVLKSCSGVALKTDVHYGIDSQEKLEYAAKDMEEDKKLSGEMSEYAYAAKEKSTGNFMNIESKYAQKIIKTCTLRIEVKDFLGSSKEIEKIVKDAGGYIENSSVRKYEDKTQSGTIIIRLPSVNFEPALAKIEKIGKIADKTMTGENVTAEFYDNEAIIKNAVVTEKRLLSFLDKAKDAKEAVEVQRELDKISEKIERYKGKQKYLEHSVSYSTINVDMNEPKPLTVSSGGTFSYIKDLSQDMLRSCVSAFATAIKGILALISFLIPVALLVLIAVPIYKLARKMKNKEVK